MAIECSSTSHSTLQALEDPQVLPKDSEQKVIVIFRALLALSDKDETDLLIAEGEPYETLVRNSQLHSRNLKEIARWIRNVAPDI